MEITAFGAHIRMDQARHVVGLILGLLVRLLTSGSHIDQVSTQEARCDQAQGFTRQTSQHFKTPTRSQATKLVCSEAF